MAGEKEEKKKSIDYIFESLVGGGSWYQWTMIAIMLPLNMIAGYPLMVNRTYTHTQISQGGRHKGTKIIMATF